jgi:phosphonate transport system substrate-binding protein
MTERSGCLPKKKAIEISMGGVVVSVGKFIVQAGYVVVFFLSFQFISFYQNLYAQELKETLKLAIIPHRSNFGNEQAYGGVIKLLEQETGINFQWIGSKTYGDVIEKLRTKQADIGYVGAFAYVEAQDDFGVRLICRTLSKNGNEFYHSMIIT